MLRVVIDTNVLVSAIISDGKPRALLQKGLDRQFSIVISDQLLDELFTVLNRPKLKTSKDEIDKIMLAMKKSAEVVKVRSKFKAVNNDPKDDAIVHAACDGQADMIVSGDGHLLDLESFRGIKIVSVREMLELLKKTG